MEDVYKNRSEDCANSGNISNNFCCINGSSSNNDEFLFYFYLWRVVTPSLFALIVAVGSFANLLVIYVIMSRPEMRRSSTNLLFVNLALADISFLLVCVPCNAYKYYA